jgi:two-component system cell cycle response regulator
MNSKQIEILLIEDNPGDVRLIREMMSEVPDVIHKIERTERLDEGLKRLTEEDFDLLLLDLRLPDSQGLDTFVKAHTQATEVPIVVLTGLEDEELGLNVVRRGAQDYLVKQKVNGSQLVRAIRYAIERKRTEETIMEMAYQDPLTGLPNRRGFSVLAQLQLKIANRKKRNLLLLFADLDDLKSINDKLGHHEGDRALIETADLLRETFRSSDIIARVGGDEFVVLAIESSKKCSEVLTDHLQKKTDTYNMKNNRPYRLSMSVGMVQYNPEYPCSIDDLINKADKLMYKQKHSNRKF